MENFGFVRVAAAVPEVKVADVRYNTEAICKFIGRAEDDGVALLSFPELSITGYTCGDLFGQSVLIDEAERAVGRIKEFTRSKSVTAVVGAPVRYRGRLFNCAIVIKGGMVRGIVPKCYIPSYGEFYESRWFASGCELLSRHNNSGVLKDDGKNFYSEANHGKILYAGKYATISPNLLFSLGNTSFAVEICEDLWTPVPQSSYHCLAGAEIILNLSASSETLAKHTYRKQLVANQSSRTISAYIYSSCGYGESTQDMVFGGASLIYENGSLSAEGRRFLKEGSIIEADIDIDKIKTARQKTSTFNSVAPDGSKVQDYSVYYSTIGLGIGPDTDFEKKLLRHIEPHPFVPCDGADTYVRAEEITSIQITALATRLEHIGCEKTVIGISGGLDSTLALIVACLAYDWLGRDRSGIIGITMPGPGTTGRTRDNAVNLMQALGITYKEISIAPAVMQHFKDIGHNPEDYDTTYENSQARERTQLLMDIANKENGIVLGTGDLSELALGWTTYNGDHMSMYGINSGIPKTLVRYLVRWAALNCFDSGGENNDAVREILLDICDTPISPELVPAAENGEILQKTEDLVGPYELHDFFLYNFFRCGYSPSKVLFLAKKAFLGKNGYTADIIEKWLKKFYWRFFSQQFKRSCLPDGPKVGSVSLSPRGDWKMPSDAKSALWLKELGD